MSLEQRVRSTLKDAGSRIDTTAERTSQPFTAAPRDTRQLRPMPAFIAAFAAVLLLFGVVSVLVSGERADPVGDSQPTFSGLLGSIVDLLPDGFDPEQAAPLLSTEDNPEGIATQYLETRMPTIGAGITRVVEEEGYTLVRWAWGRLLDPESSRSERGETGWLLLRPVAKGYELVAATTDGVDLSDLSIGDGAVKGVVESDSGQFIGADVLSLDGSPVDSAPHPDGFIPEAGSLWGTAGATDPPNPLVLDIPVSEPVIIRVNRVGGTLLSVSEVILGSEVEVTSSSRYSTVHDMREKVEQAGLQCDKWLADTPRGFRSAQNEQESAECTLHTSFMIFLTSTPRSEARAMVRRTQTVYANEGQTSAVVYGDNWVVDCSGNTVECETIHNALGGKIEVVQGDPEQRDGDLLPAIACSALPAAPAPGDVVAFFTLCGGDPGLPPVPVYRTGELPGIEDAVRTLIAGTTSEESAVGYRSGFDEIPELSALEVTVDVDQAGVAHVDITEDGQRWQPGTLAGTSHQLFSLFDPLIATVFHYPQVTALDLTTLCWGESDCTGVMTREVWESTLFINMGAIVSGDCDLEDVWFDQDHCTLQAAIDRQHFETVRRDLSDTVTMRAGPGTNYVALAELQPGDQVAVLERPTADDEGNEWELIIPSSTTQAGWVPAETLDPATP